jgi:putative redox protein
MEVMVEYLGAVQFQVAARNHTVVCDQPEENGGFDEGMTPPELLLASLGTCAGYYAAQYLKARKLNGAGMRIRVTAEKATGPARLSSFRIEVQIAAELDVRHRQGVLRAIQSCLIHNTLLNPPRIELDAVVAHQANPDLAA